MWDLLADTSCALIGSSTGLNVGRRPALTPVKIKGTPTTCDIVVCRCKHGVRVAVASEVAGGAGVTGRGGGMCGRTLVMAGK